MLNTWIIFIKAHERLILILAGLAALLYFGNMWENHRHDEAVANVALTKATLDAQIQKNQQLAQDVATSKLAYDKLAAQVSTQNALIVTQIAAMNQKVQQQQQVDQNLSLADLAIRWRTLINSAQPTDIQPAGSSLSVSEQASHQTVNDLEMVDSLHQEVLAGHKIEDNLTSEVNSCQAVNTAQAAQINGLTVEITDQKKACDAKISLVKADARKSKIRWIIGSFVGGIVAALKLGL